MPRHLLLLLTLAAAALVAGCGSAAPEPASSNTDVNTLLSDTFRNVSKIDSANLSAQLAIQGGGESVAAKLNGPFESQGEGKLPKLQMDATLTSGGQSFTAGATWTGDKGFVNVQGTQYELSGLVAKQLQAGYQESLKQSSKQGSGDPGALLGIDFSKWLKNGQNAGEADVNGTETIKITGDADVAQVVDDIQKVAAKAGSLQVPGTSQVPTTITPEQKQQVVDAVKKFAIEVYTGKEDRILRKLVVNADLQDPSSKQASHLSFELTLDKLGESQKIEAPKNAKPFSELMKMTDELKGLAGGLAGNPADSASGGSGSAGAPSSDAIEKYAKCVTDAGGDQAKAQKCADLIGS